MTEAGFRVKASGVARPAWNTPDLESALAVPEKKRTPEVGSGDVETYPNTALKYCRWAQPNPLMSAYKGVLCQKIGNLRVIKPNPNTMFHENRSAKSTHSSAGVVANRNNSGISRPAVEPFQLKPNNTGLPDNLKSGIENLSGISMDDVNVHYNSDKPFQLQALAYAQGTDIHVAPGQERHLPHEAWHVVQQKQGRVQATMQIKSGVNVNDDAGLEREADMMGQRALQSGGGNVHSLSASPLLNKTTQLKVVQLLSVTVLPDVEYDEDTKIKDILIDGRPYKNKKYIEKHGGTTDRHILPWENIKKGVLEKVLERGNKTTIGNAAEYLDVEPSISEIENAIEERLKEIDDYDNHFLGPEEENSDRNSVNTTLKSRLNKAKTKRDKEALGRAIAFNAFDTPTYGDTPWSPDTHKEKAKSFLTNFTPLTPVKNVVLTYDDFVQTPDLLRKGPYRTKEWYKPGTTRRLYQDQDDSESSSD